MTDVPFSIPHHAAPLTWQVELQYIASIGSNRERGNAPYNPSGFLRLRTLGDSLLTEHQALTTRKYECRLRYLAVVRQEATIANYHCNHDYVLEVSIMVPHITRALIPNEMGSWDVSGG